MSREDRAAGPGSKDVTPDDEALADLEPEPEETAEVQGGRWIDRARSR